MSFDSVGLSLRIALNVEKPKRLKNLIAAIKTLSDFSVRARKSGGLMLVELPAFAFTKLEPILDATNHKLVKIQLVEYDMSLYREALRRREVAGKNKLILVAKTMNRQPHAIRELTSPCAPGSSEYDYIKRVLRGLETF